jgi:hypothetical protein
VFVVVLLHNSYAYAIASGCVISLWKLAHHCCNTSALSAAFHHIFTSHKIENTLRLLHRGELLPNFSHGAMSGTNFKKDKKSKTQSMLEHYP